MNLQDTVRDYVNDEQKPNYSGFVVIGAGLPRTGTMSMRAALGQVLDGACYHMMAVATGTKVDWDFWHKALEGNVKNEDWVDFLQRRGFRAGVDYPISLFYKELMKAYPDAKVVLTLRNPETWYESVKGTIYRMRALHADPVVKLFSILTGMDYMMRTVNGTSKKVFDVIAEGKEASVKFFNDHTEEVKRVVPKDRLLVFEVKEGWKPLCDFIGVPVPDGPFPRVNDSSQIQGLMTKVTRMAYMTLLGAPVAIGAAGYFLMNYLG